MPFGALIIERASMMSEEGVAAMCELLKAPGRSILIIMIDRKGVMDAFLHETSDTQGVLDGDLNDFMKVYLMENN